MKFEACCDEMKMRISLGYYHSLYQLLIKKEDGYYCPYCDVKIEITVKEE